MTSNPSQEDQLTTITLGQDADDTPPLHEGKRARKDLPPTRMQLNLTSMIDVIFQLLIYFVITASFAVGEGVIAANLPGQGQGTSAAELPKTPLNIVVASRGTYAYQIRIEGITTAPSDFKALSELLVSLQNDPQRGRRGAYPADNPIMIKPDGAVRWQHVVNAFNAAVAARYSNISFAQAGS